MLCKKKREREETQYKFITFISILRGGIYPLINSMLEIVQYR